MAAADIYGALPTFPIQNLGPSMQDSNNTQDHFRRWRPRYHLMGPKGWMNDPCALGYDPKSKRYITAFQWNPNGNDWGEIAWGYASSSDLLSWDVSSRPSLSPSAPYDKCGVFTGCLIARNTKGEEDGSLTCFYTSVSKLPISFLLPYSVGCESLSIATSTDGGLSWQRCDANPILPQCPQDLKVSGWRDPYVSSWPSVDRALGREPGKYLYGCISGGIKEDTPTTFLYSVEASNLQNWSYLGPLMHVGLNNNVSKWSGDLGVNWEVTTFCSLSDSKGTSRDFLVVGAEGGKEKFHAQLWVCGEIEAKTGSEESKVGLRRTFGGVFDHGCLYAANAFWDPVEKEQVVIGWIPEEDLSTSLRHRQNWSGLLSLPRVIYLLNYERVSKALASDLKDITSFEVVPDAEGTFTVRTLGFMPDNRVTNLRNGADSTDISDSPLVPSQPSAPSLPVYSQQWEFEVDIALQPSCTAVTITIGHSSDFRSCTKLIFTPQTETFSVIRQNLSTIDSNINTAPIEAPHTLLTTLSPDDRTAQQEHLYIRAFFDQSALEIFVNDRTAVTTRVYAETSRCYGVRFAAEAGSTENKDMTAPAAVLVAATSWDGLKTPRPV